MLYICSDHVEKNNGNHFSLIRYNGEFFKAVYIC